MKEMIEKLLAVFPAYARQLIGLLSGPKRYIFSLDYDAPGALQDALIFIAVSCGIASVVNIPLLPETQNREQFFGLLAVIFAIDLLLTIAITVLSWKLVGGKFDLKQLTIAVCYFSGVAALLASVPVWIALGSASLIDPVHYRLFRQMVSGSGLLDPIEMIKSPAYLVFAGVLGLVFLGGYIWNFFVWGAYRNMAGLSKVRSGIAFGIFVILALLLSVADVLMTSSIAGIHKNPLPKNLLGEWQAQSESDSNGAHAVHRISYGFFSDDSYYVVDNLRTTTGACIASVVVHAHGIASVDAPSVQLISTTRMRDTSDSCTGKKSSVKMDRESEVYQYRISEQPSGWQLCLGNRFGESCYAPEKR
ncbi:MAG TPA: hypothetical protein VKH40_15175 [Alloacidobacterium sp.]|nr:hypothetical protein [Alloacidobacterium sp.]